MNVNLIYAKSANNVIGYEGKMPWHIPEDLAYFSRVTNEDLVIMGSRTWRSLPERAKPLPNRLNLVVTTDATLAPEVLSKGGIVFCDQDRTDIKKVIRHFRDAGYYSNVWIIGGSVLFDQALPYAHYSYVTEIEAEYPGDTFAPVLDPSSWIKISNKRAISQVGVMLNFCIYENQHPLDVDRIYVD